MDRYFTDLTLLNLDTAAETARPAFDYTFDPQGPDFLCNLKGDRFELRFDGVNIKTGATARIEREALLSFAVFGYAIDGGIRRHRLDKAGIPGHGVYEVNNSTLIAPTTVARTEPPSHWRHYVVAVADYTLEVVATELVVPRV